RILVEAAERAAATGDRIGELCARLHRGVTRLQINPEGAAAELEALIAEAQPELEAAGDDFVLYLFYFARAVAAHFRSRFDEESAAMEQMLFYGERTGLPHLAAFAGMGGGASRFWGATPLSDLLAWIDQREARYGPDWRMLGWKAGSLALIGRFEEARRL